MYRTETIFAFNPGRIVERAIAGLGGLVVQGGRADEHSDSMSAVGNPYQNGNAQAESFMKTLKVEDVYLAGSKTFPDVTERGFGCRICQHALARG
ncbi:hypothetical protein CPY51_29350 [Rhizobium tubonense]|uniref:Uncharacterized protein n=1 Tax=Rhizobium tubonense TaxID=484088 RepID=A0A2W4CAF1_9HYPH|nr:hypothetical protein CPY51_29350 [Rhizobium tubonense]